MSDDDFLSVEANDCPMSSCAAPAGSPCRTGRGRVAAQYHTARFRLVPRLAKARAVPVPPTRRPGSVWTEMPRPAAVGAVIPDQKLFATIPAAVAGALYFIIQQLKLAERSNAHFKRYNALHLLSIELDVAALKGAKYETIEQVLRKYAKIIEDTDKIFAGITVSLGQTANTSSQDNVASKEADKHPIKPV